MLFQKRHHSSIFFSLVLVVLLTIGIKLALFTPSNFKTLQQSDNLKENQGLTKSVLATTSTNFYPIADAFVQSYYGNNKNSNAGDNLAINVVNLPDYIVYSYLKFDLTPLAGKTITSARLQIHKICSSQDEASPVRVKSVSDTTWGENTITWNNKPALGSQIGSFAIDYNEWSNVDILSYVNTKKGSLASIGLDTNTDSDCLDSREQSYPPRIVVVYDNPPTPTPTTIPTPTPTPAPAGNIVNLNFGITNLNPWMQSVCGDIRIDEGINNPVPSGHRSNTTNASCPNPGIIFSGDGAYTFGQGQASSTNWIVGGTVYPEVFRTTPSSSLLSSYSYLLAKATQSGLSIIDMASICSLSNCTLPSNLAHGIYKADSDVSLNTYTFPANQNYVFLINGNLTIKGNILVPSGSTDVFATTGDITIDKSVGSAPSSTAPNIQGIFISNNSFIINSNNNCADLRLNIGGTVITNAGMTGGSLQNNRDLCSGDANYPVVSFTQRLDFFFNLPTILKRQNTYSWETAP